MSKKKQDKPLSEKEEIFLKEAEEMKKELRDKK